MIPSYTIAGQLATFIDNGEGGLGLTYKEATEIIPYELILLMQKDKAHIASKDTMVEVENEEDYIRDRNINFIN